MIGDDSMMKQVDYNKMRVQREAKKLENHSAKILRRVKNANGNMTRAQRIMVCKYAGLLYRRAYNMMESVS